MRRPASPSFGSRFLEAFRGSGWNQAEIARRLNVSGATVSDYVGARIPPAETLLTITELTGCSLHWLLTGIGPQYIVEPHSTALLIHPSPNLREALEQLAIERGVSLDEQISTMLRSWIISCADDAIDPAVVRGLLFELIETPKRSKSRRQGRRGEKANELR